MKSSPHTGAVRKTAERVYGLAAAKAAFEARPQAVMSIAYTAALRKPLAELLRSAARRRIAYREVDPAELTRMAQSVHHEGVCLLVIPRELPEPSALLGSVREGGLILALDGVENPHNVGAILRSAAYFGARGLLHGAKDSHEKSPTSALPAAARRVAEGGAEWVPALRVADLTEIVRQATRAQIAVIGCDARADVALPEFVWPKRALLVLGHEQRGLSRAVRALCQAQLRIAGSPHIDSLNVSVAAGIFLASYAQAHGVCA